MFLIDKILGIGEKVLDRVVPDVNKRQDQEHETRMRQADTTQEGERQRNYFTPRAMILYVLGFGMCYSIVIQPFLVAFGIPAPYVDMSKGMALLAALLGLG